MKKIFFALLLLSKVSFSQTYQHYKYNRGGVPVKTGYTKVVEPRKFSPYIPPSSLALEERTLQIEMAAKMRLQADFDKNLSEIKSLVQRFSDLNLILSDLNYNKAVELTNNINAYIEKLSSVRLDYAKSSVFLPIKSTLEGYIQDARYYITYYSKNK